MSELKSTQGWCLSSNLKTHYGGLRQEKRYIQWLTCTDCLFKNSNVIHFSRPNRTNVIQLPETPSSIQPAWMPNAIQLSAWKWQTPNVMMPTPHREVIQRRRHRYDYCRCGRSDVSTPAPATGYQERFVSVTPFLPTQEHITSINSKIQTPLLPPLPTSWAWTQLSVFQIAHQPSTVYPCSQHQMM